MRKTFLTFCVAALSLLAVSSCGKIEDSLNKLDQGLKDLAARVDRLEKDLNDKIDALSKTVTALDAAYKAADAELLAKIEAGDKELAAEITALTTKLDAVDGKVDGYIKSNDEALAAALKQYQEDLKKLGDSMTEAQKQFADADAEILKALATVGVTKVEKNEDGNAVLTFVDGTTLVVGAYDPNANNTGVVTVVEDEDGVKYWAVVLEDGTKKSLEIPVSHTEIDFKVDEDNYLLYSVNGGEWVSTGAYVADDQDSLIDFYWGETDEIDWDTYEYVKEDFYTVVFGGETYYLPIYKVDNSVVTIKAGKTYFAYGEAQTIDVAVADVTEMYVMTKPDGWKAKLNGTKLTVTAPAEANVASGVAESDGEVLLHCTTVEGKCKIAKLAVSTTEGFSLTVNADGTFKFVNPILNISDYGADFGEAVIGLANVSAFEKNPVAYVNAITNGEDHWDDVVTYVSNWKNNTMDWDTYEYTIGGTYMPGEYEVDVIESSVADLYNYYTYSEVPRGSQFIVWAAPVSNQGVVNTDELVFGYYTPMEVVIEAAGEPSFNEVPVSLTLYGAEKFYVGHVAKDLCFNWNTEQYDLKEYLSMYISYLQYGVNYIGKEFEAGEYEVNLSELVNEFDEQVKLNPNAEYFAFVLPIISGKAAADYSFDDVFAFDFKTSPLTAGGSASVAFENIAKTYTSFALDMVADADVEMVYYNWYTADEYNELDDVTTDLLENGYIFSGNEGSANKSVNPGDSYIIAAVAVNAEGQYGDVYEETLTAPTITYSTTFVAKVGEPVFTEYTQYGQTNYKVNIPVTVEGGEAAKYYYYWNTTARTEEQLKQLPLGTKGYYYYLNSTAVPKDLVFYKSSTSYQYAVVVESTTGELSAPVIVTVNNPDAE
ncbi:MAG: hypothetical protein IKV91_03440 [Bacteroidales bacterium]|nr:hypothetical protein [Bacteroidales bacterium]